MDPRDFVRSNGYLGLGLVSVNQVVLNLAPGTNWVCSQPPIVVKLDPQVGVGAVPPESDFRLQPELSDRRPRRKLMAELVSDFALLHDELLNELAR